MAVVSTKLVNVSGVLSLTISKSTCVTNGRTMDINAAKITAELKALIDATAKQVDLLQRPTNPLLTTDTRLNNLDAAISTRLSTASYTAPANSSILSAISAIPTTPLLAADYVAPSNATIATLDRRTKAILGMVA